MKNFFLNKDIVSMDQFDTEALLYLFQETKNNIENNFEGKKLNGKHATLLFYEPSSRTYGSFSSAIQRLGGTTTAVLNPGEISSVHKGESFEDTLRTFECYSDLIVLRHPEKGSATKAAKVLNIPLINAGDGAGDHPTQTFYDLYTIWQHTKGKLSGLTGVMCGDILHSRTILSLLKGLALFPNNKIYLLSLKELRLDQSLLQQFKKRGLQIIEVDSPDEIPKDADFWYWNRIQKERFSSEEEYAKLKNRFILTKEFLSKYGNNNLIIMDPLPRVEEIDTEVDSDPRAVYLTTQMRNGLHIRMTLLSLIFD